MTKDEWKAELEQLFLHYQPKVVAMDSDDAEAGPVEQDDEQAKKSFEKTKAVYPHINYPDDLKTTSVEELLKHDAVANAFGPLQTLAMPTRNEFSRALAAYIDSGGSSDRNSALWPLIKVVRVYVKAPILENRIILVDFPGSADSNSARSAVAGSYLRKLTVTCIVANVVRGLDE